MADLAAIVVLFAGLALTLWLGRPARADDPPVERHAMTRLLRRVDAERAAHPERES
jgi:hypothetical protein